jgi:hypothetical protein
MRLRTLDTVMPAQAGIHVTRRIDSMIVAWIPAFAGMTYLGGTRGSWVGWVERKR